jgi:hypothetical protein
MDAGNLISSNRVGEWSLANAVNIAAGIHKATSALDGCLGARMPLNAICLVLPILDVPCHGANMIGVVEETCNRVLLLNLLPIACPNGPAKESTSHRSREIPAQRARREGARASGPAREKGEISRRAQGGRFLDVDGGVISTQTVQASP